jgi:hypothetical protein
MVRAASGRGRLISESERERRAGWCAQKQAGNGSRGGSSEREGRRSGLGMG